MDNNDKVFENYVEDSKKILEQLMKPDLPLDKSMQLYKDGLNQLKMAQDILEKTKLEYQELKFRQE